MVPANHRTLRARVGDDIMPQNSFVRARSSEPSPSFANENNPVQTKFSAVTQPRSITRAFMNIVAWAERKNRASAVLPDRAVHDTRLFAWATDLESNWGIIRGELAQLMMRKNIFTGRESNATETIGEDRGWTTFVLADYFVRSETNIARCPETWRLAQKVPGLVSVMFSVLEPGKRLPPHHGPYNGLLRLHLGLIVPEPREAVGIRINGDVHHWDEGRALIFDDTFEHEARNESNHTRVVLFIDFEKPLRFPARVVNRRLLRSYFFRPFVREGAEKRGWWARRYYREVQALREAQLAVKHPPEKTIRQERPARVSDAFQGRVTAPPEALAREWPFDTEKV